MPSPTARALAPRVEHLERQVEHLDNRVRALEGHEAPSTGEREAPAPEGPRCPGCHLQVEDPAARRCGWCGFVFSAARPRRRSR